MMSKIKFLFFVAAFPFLSMAAKAEWDFPKYDNPASAALSVADDRRTRFEKIVAGAIPGWCDDGLLPLWNGEEVVKVDNLEQLWYAGCESIPFMRAWFTNREGDIVVFVSENSNYFLNYFHVFRANEKGEYSKTNEFEFSSLSLPLIPEETIFESDGIVLSIGFKNLLVLTRKFHFKNRVERCLFDHSLKMNSDEGIFVEMTEN